MTKILMILIVCAFAVCSEARSLRQSRIDRELYLFRRFIQKRGEEKLEKCLEEINRIRKEHGADALAWGDKYLIRDALKFAERENKEGHLSKDPAAHTGGSEQGEINAIVHGGGSHEEKCIEAVKMWASKKQAYKSAGGCGNPDGPKDNAGEEFSQLVWKDSMTVAIAVAGDVVEARFEPAGNNEDYDLEVEC